MVDVLSEFTCPRCGLPVVEALASPCGDCRNQLNRIYADRNRVRIAALAHLVPEDFNVWLTAPNSELGGMSPWQYIDAGETNSVIELVKTLKRTRPVEDD